MASLSEEILLKLGIDSGGMTKGLGAAEGTVGNFAKNIASRLKGILIAQVFQIGALALEQLGPVMQDIFNRIYGHSDFLAAQLDRHRKNLRQLRLEIQAQDAADAAKAAKEDQRIDRIENMERLIRDVREQNELLNKGWMPDSVLFRQKKVEQMLREEGRLRDIASQQLTTEEDRAKAILQLETLRNARLLEQKALQNESADRDQAYQKAFKDRMAGASTTEMTPLEYFQQRSAERLEAWMSGHVDASGKIGGRMWNDRKQQVATKTDQVMTDIANGKVRIRVIPEMAK
jgi:hypothetical protein